MRQTAAQVKLLSKLACGGGLPHALLFAGRGEARSKTAFAFAKFLVHTEDDFERFLKTDCTCDICAQISRGGHPDFFSIDISPIPIGEMRKLKSRLSASPIIAKYKVAFIDNAEYMQAEAANSILKLLEEPRGRAVIILTAASPSLLLPTIASRAVAIKFPASPALPIPPSHLSEIATLESAPLHVKLAVAEKYRLDNKAELISLLDSWLIKMRGDALQNQSIAKIDLAKKVLKVKNTLLYSNANPQLLFEEAILSQYA